MAANMMPPMFSKDRVTVIGRAKVTISCLGVPSTGIKPCGKNRKRKSIPKLPVLSVSVSVDNQV